MRRGRLSSENDLLRAAVDQIRHGVVIYDRELIVVSINNRAREILRVPEELFRAGEPFEKLVRVNAEHGGYGGADSVDQHVASRMEKARSFEPFSADQQVFYGDRIEAYGQPVPSGGYVITYTDITKRVVAEQAVRRSEKRSLDFAETSSDWFWETDANHRYSFFSNTFEVMTGFKRSDWIGRDRYGPLMDASDKHQERARHKADLDAKKPFQDYKYSFLRPDGGEIWISVSGRPVFDDFGLFVGYRGTSKDITRQTRLEASLRETSEREQAANKAKSDFLSSMSHELRTPLNAIIGFGQLLEIDTDDPLSTDQKVAVREILRGGNHLLSLIDQVLDLNQIETGNLSIAAALVETTPIIEECIALVGSASRDRGLILEVIGDVEGLMVWADPVRLKQVLLNLLINAVKYNTTGARVGLELSRPGPNRVRFAVSDDGPGIPIDRQNALFKPFDRLGIEAKGIEGTGIGLTISRNLVELMGGEISVKSAAGEGALFWFDLPIRDPAA
jgi:PAS domain S-box-containing protein